MKRTRILLTATLVALAAACTQSPVAPEANRTVPTGTANFGNNTYGSGL